MLEDEYVIPLLNELLFYGVVAVIAVSSDMVANVIWEIVYSLFLNESLAFLEISFIGLYFLFPVVARALSGSVLAGTITNTIRGILSIVPYLFPLNAVDSFVVITVMTVNLVNGIAVDVCFYLAYLTSKKHLFPITGIVLPVIHIIIANPVVIWSTSIFIPGFEYDLQEIVTSTIVNLFPNLVIGAISGLLIAGLLAQLVSFFISKQNFLPFNASFALRELLAVNQ